MAKNRYRTTWGATTLLTAELDVYKQLIEDLKWNFSFVITLSESDFPTKPIEVLSEFLSMFPNQNFVSGNIPNIFNRDFIQYVAYGDDELIRGLRFAFNYTAMPCESFYHTVLINSIYCDSHVRMNLRMVNWDRRRGCTCYNMDVSDLCGCSPLIYRITDKRKFAEAAGELLFFARKFDPTVDEKIIDWIDEKISGLNLSEVFIRQNSRTSIFSKLIKQFDIGFTIDTRNNVFIDRSRTFIEPKIVTVLIEWTSEMNEEVSLVMEDPTGNVITRISITQSDEMPMIDIPFPEITSECMIGIWNMYLLSNSINDTLASLNFLILSANQTETNDD
ncbi:unnamed protein product, partial [Rotaria sp. Silwood2]